MKTITTLLLALVVGTTMAQTTLPTKRVTLFKNGTALIVKEGTATIKDGNAVLPIPTNVLFGTFFVGSTKDNTVKSIVFQNDTVKSKVVCKSVWQFLAGNVNKAVTIHYAIGDQKIDKALSGKVTEYNPNIGVLKFLSDDGKTVIITVANIYQADFKDDPSSYYKADSIKRVALLTPEKQTENINLQQVYMTNGFNWIPSYYLKIKDGKTARLDMKATVENFGDDLAETETELVVGAPEMNYSSKLDPITYDYLTVNPPSEQYRPAAYMQKNAVNLSTRSAGLDAPSFEPDQFATEGEKTGDLYIYNLGKVTLRKEAKGIFPIFSTTVNYKDKYEGVINDRTNFYYSQSVPNDEQPIDIFHSLEITNNTNVPLTTASVMVMNEKEQFLAQNELKYTPVGSMVNVRLSKAIDIVMKNNEELTSRYDNVKWVGKTNYSVAIIKGVVNVNNFQDKEVTVSITKLLAGNVTGQSDNGVSKMQKNGNYINPQSTIKWDVKLGGGEKKTITYQYEVYFVGR